MGTIRKSNGFGNRRLQNFRLIFDVDLTRSSKTVVFNCLRKYTNIQVDEVIQRIERINETWQIFSSAILYLKVIPLHYNAHLKALRNLIFFQFDETLA